MHREHPIPESMGNTTIELPRGVVCDRCNGGVLSDLDQALLEFFPVKLRRTTLGIPNKAGKVPTTVFQDGELRHNGSFAAIHGDPPPRSWREEGRIDRDHTVGTVTISGGRPLTARHAALLSRGLLKVGLGSAWTEQRERLYDRGFNALRDLILGRLPKHPGFLLIVHGVDERNRQLNVRFHAMADAQGLMSLMVFANFYGVQMVTDSRLSDPPEGLLELGYVARFGERR